MTSPDLASAIRGFQNELASMSARLKMLEQNQRSSQIANSSVDNGSLTFNDASGNPQVVLGLQPDGTFAHASVTSQAPLAPDAPLTAPGVLGVMVTWDGGMSDGSGPLADFAGIQVHLSPVAGYAPGPATLQGVMPGPGTFGVGGLSADLTYFACLVAYNVAGNLSPASAPVPVVPQSVPANIPVGSISGLQIRTGAITFQQLAMNAGILGEQIASQTITGDNIAANTIDANLLTAGIVIAGVIDGTTVSAPTINGGVINGSVFNGTNWEANAFGQFFYSGTPALGDLSASITTGTGTEQHGNLYEGGINAYVTVNGTPWAVGLNQSLVTAFGSMPGASVVSTAAPPYNAAGLGAQSSSTVAHVGLSSGMSVAGDAPAMLYGQSAADSGISGGAWRLQAGQMFFGNGPATVMIDDNHGALVLIRQLGAPPAVAGGASFFVDRQYNASYVCGLDGNAYRTGRLIIIGTSGQLISSNSPTVITGTTLTMAGGMSYHLAGAVTYTGTSASGSAQFGFGGGSAALGHVDGRAWFVGPGVTNISIWSGSIGLAGGPALTGGPQRWEFDIWVICSVSGTFILRAQEGTSGSSFTVNSVYTRVETYN